MRGSGKALREEEKAVVGRSGGRAFRHREQHVQRPWGGNKLGVLAELPGDRGGWRGGRIGGGTGRWGPDCVGPRRPWYCGDFVLGAEKAFAGGILRVCVCV